MRRDDMARFELSHLSSHLVSSQTCLVVSSRHIPPHTPTHPPIPHCISNEMRRDRIRQDKILHRTPHMWSLVSCVGESYRLVLCCAQQYGAMRVDGTAETAHHTRQHDSLSYHIASASHRTHTNIHTHTHTHKTYTQCAAALHHDWKRNDITAWH